MDQTLSDQLEAVHDWLKSDGAYAHASAIVAKRRLTDIDPEGLINEAWIRVDRSLARRSEPYPDLAGEESVRRFAYRVLDNLAIDRARSSARRSEALVPLVDEHQAPVAEPGFEQVDQRDLLVRLIEHIPDVAAQLPTCPGCAHDVVVALALDVCQSLLVDREGDFDALVYAGLRRVAGEPDEDVPATPAERQRKARCGRCTRLLLETAFTMSRVT